VKPLAAIANALWIGGGVPASRRFARALRAPADAQARWLGAQLQQHASCEFGQAHDFPALRSPTDFARAVPLSDATDIASWISRMQLGEQRLLTADLVTHLAPTSGSSGARKLIPFTTGLQAGFSAAVSAWMVDLTRQRPALIGGPSYWSISPLTDVDEHAASGDAVRVGFADDAEYLGGWATAFVRQALAVPSSVRHVRCQSDFWALTLLALLRQRDLRLLSMWHPSFLQLLVSSAIQHWPALLTAIESGECPWESAIPMASRRDWRAPRDATRAAELRRIGADDWPRWWPALQVVSCWGDQAAAAGRAAIARRLPGVLVQSKGLLATEGVVTVPIGTAYPLAVTSHFFEFLDRAGDLRLAHELHAGDEYEVIITNGGGLWRYRLGDIVECRGHLEATPSLRFLGRGGNVSDLRGEKLTESFVAACLVTLWAGREAPAEAELHAADDGVQAWYELRLDAECSADMSTEIAVRLDTLLRVNPHYALARRLGQLSALRVASEPESLAVRRTAAGPVRLGDVKPRTLVPVARVLPTALFSRGQSP